METSAETQIQPSGPDEKEVAAPVLERQDEITAEEAGVHEKVATATTDGVVDETVKSGENTTQQNGETKVETDEQKKGADSDANTSSQEDQPRKKRKYNKGIFNDDGLSGSYWKSPVVATTEESSRPRRSNAGSLMKTALQEIDRKKKGNSPAKAEKATAAATATGRKSVGATSTAAKEEEQKPAASKVIARKSEPGPPAFRVQPYEKPVTRGRGRPRKLRPATDEEQDEDSDYEEKRGKSSERKPPKLVPEQNISPPTPKTPVRTYGRRAAAAAAAVASAGTTPDKSPKTVVPPVVRTYGRRRSAAAQKTEEQDTEESSDAGTTPISSGTSARVSPSTALIAALSIPDEILPTSHEKFLDKFRETQEKSPTPPERRVHNLDEVVATFKSSARTKSVLESELNTPADSSESDGDSEGDSGGSSHSDEKENMSTSTTVPSIIESGARPVKWGEDEKPNVVKLGPNKLSINDQVVDIDYTNYVKEADVELPYDYDVIFQPEPKLEILAPTGCDSNPSSPKQPPPPLEEDEECKLDACKKGCVCKSLRRPPPEREHCGKSKCFLECSCLFNKDHVLINADEKNIRSRLRPRVTLLNWKDITKNGGSDQTDDRADGGSAKKHKHHHKKKDHSGKGKKARERESEEPVRKRLKAAAKVAGLVTKDVDSKTSPLKSARGQLQQQQQQQPVVYKPGPKCSKPLFMQGGSPGKPPTPSPQKGGRGAAGRQARRPPTLISTRYASNLPILRRIYSCQPCNVKLTRMPKQWSHWSTVESKCASGVPRRVPIDPANVRASIPFHVATSNFRLSAQDDLSYAIVRPNGTILALLYWEAHTKEIPRSVQPPTENSRELSFPWLYLPLPSSGKVWLFYEIPKYPVNQPAVFLPELGVFLPTDKLMLMTFEANQTKKTSKLYFEPNDESRMTDKGLVNFVYLVPNLPSLIVYGPVPKTCLKTFSQKGMADTLRKFEESEECKHLREKLANVGTDVEEIGVGGGDGIDEFVWPGPKYAPEYEDDYDRGTDLIDESIWERHYREFMIPADGVEDDDDETNGIDYGVEYDYDAGYMELDEVDSNQDLWDETEAVEMEEEKKETTADTTTPATPTTATGPQPQEEVKVEEKKPEQPATATTEDPVTEDVNDVDIEDESEFLEEEDIVLINDDSQDGGI